MPHDPIPYDPAKEALYYPERDAPVPDFSTAWELEQICAELSRLAYVRFESGDQPRLSQLLVAAGFADPGCFNDDGKDAQAFGTSAADTAYVSFRGTQADRLKDLLADANFLLHDWEGGGQVHQGFWKAYEALRVAIDAWLGEQRKGRLVITGHSLGAAMATLMAARYPNAILVTFGSPRVGTADFAAQFEGRDVRRYVDCTDLVATVPPPVVYTHVREMRYIDRLGRVKACPPGALTRLQDAWLARLAFWRKCVGRPGNVELRMLADHAPINYISAVLGRRSGP